LRNRLEKRYHPGRKFYVQALQKSREFDPATTILLPRTDKDRLLKQIHLETNKFLFDLPLLEHHNIRPFEVNALNGESTI
jgi:hypothetical protein